MGRAFQPAQLVADTGIPIVRYQEYKAAETFIVGAVLIADGTTGDVKEAANAVKTGIWGVAMQRAGSAPGQDLSFSSLVNATYGVTNLQRKIAMAVANRVTTFSGRMVNGGTDPVTPAQTDLGVSYALIRTVNADGSYDWTINQADAVTNPAVTIVGFDSTVPLVYFKFIESSLAQP